MPSRVVSGRLFAMPGSTRSRKTRRILRTAFRQTSLVFMTFGNIWDSDEDCWHDSCHGAPTDGGAWVLNRCHRRVQRGGSIYNRSDFLRSANRNFVNADYRFNRFGFRVARSLDTRPR